MAKVNLFVTLKKNDGTAIGMPIDSGDRATRTEAEAAVAAVIQQRVDGANAAAALLLEAQAAFNG